MRPAVGWQNYYTVFNLEKLALDVGRSIIETRKDINTFTERQREIEREGEREREIIVAPLLWLSKFNFLRESHDHGYHLF